MMFQNLPMAKDQEAYYHEFQKPAGDAGNDTVQASSELNPKHCPGPDAHASTTKQTANEP